MLHIDDKTNKISADCFKDISDELKKTEKLLDKATRKTITENEKNDLLIKISRIEPLMELLNNDFKSKANPFEMISVLKTLARIKELSEKLKND